MDYQKGNYISCEHGELPILHVVFNDYQVQKPDGRVLWAKKVEPIKITTDKLINLGFTVDENQDYELIIGRKGFYICESQDGDFVLMYRNNIGLNHYPLEFVDYIHEIQNIIEALTGTKLEIKL